MAFSTSLSNTKRRRDEFINYLNGTSKFNKGFSALRNTVGPVADIYNGVSGLTTNELVLPIGSMYTAINSKDPADFFKNYAANFLAPGIPGIVNAINNSRYNRDLRKIKKNIDVSNFSGFTNDELDALLDYYTDQKGWWFTKHDDIDEEAFLRDYNDFLEWKDKVGPAPAYIDYDKVYADANAAVDNEFKQVMDIYDQGMDRTTNLLNDALEENRQSFNDFRNQILTNDAMSRQEIAGSTRSELDRQQRNAISRGASAAQRLVSNINTQLGMQAQAAQQSLNTSNVLAQQLLAQRQASAGIRSEYANAQNQYDTNRANLINGQYERRQNARANAAREAETRYNQAVNQWEQRLNAYAGDSPYADFYRKSQTRNNTNKSPYAGI